MAQANKSIDLERREDRFIIYIKDTTALVKELQQITDVIEYPDTPVTQTIYIGDDVRGLPPEISIKARSYTRDRCMGQWEAGNSTIFNLLELKKTVSIKEAEKVEDALPPNKKLKKTNSNSKKFGTKFFSPKGGYEEIYEIFSLSSQSFAANTMKMKKRTDKINLVEILNLLQSPVDFQNNVDKDLYMFLLENIHPLEDFNWGPLTGTEYRRIHFKAKDENFRDSFRATLDRRVVHFSFQKENGYFVGVPVATENFSRLEIKADYSKLLNTVFGKRIADIILNFRAFPIPSKKYRGLTERGKQFILKQGLKNEILNKKVYGCFYASPVRYKDREHYVNLVRYINTSATFKIFGKNPVLLEEHINTIQAKEKNLLVTITGNTVIYEHPPIIKKLKTFFVTSRDIVPVSVIPIESRVELQPDFFKKFKDKKNDYLRSKGFLVQHKKSKRVYKVSFEREIYDKKSKSEGIKIEYMGKAGLIKRFNPVKKVEDEILMLGRFLRKYPLFKHHQRGDI